MRELIVFLDEEEKAKKEMGIEKTLIIIKPDAVRRGLVGEILSRFERAGITLLIFYTCKPSINDTLKHCHDLHERYGEEVQKKVAEFLSSGLCVFILAEGIHVIQKVRAMIGGTYPGEAAPGTIRGDYGTCTKLFAQTNNAIVENLIHASDSPENAAIEIPLWFGDYITTANREKDFPFES